MKTIDCGGCGATLDVAALAPGTTFSCGACGASLTVPAAPVPVQPDPAAAPPPRRPAPAAASTPAPRIPRTPRVPRGGRAARGGGEAAARPKSKGPLVGGILAAVVILGGGIAFLASRKGGEPAPEPDRPALGPETAGAEPEEPKEPEPVLSPEEKAWRDAGTEAARLAFLEKRLEDAAVTEEGAKELHAFLTDHGRKDLAEKVAEARLEAEPGSPWGNLILDRTDMGEELRALADAEEASSLESEEGKRILDRVQAGRTWVDRDEVAQVRADLAVAKAELERLTDPWWKEANSLVQAIESHPAFQRFTPVLHDADPPYLVIAQVNDDSHAHATVNVLANHKKFFHCLTGEFLGVMEAAGLPSATLAEMGSPVLKAFVFKSRNSFDRWHWDQRWPKDALKGVRAYYAWGSNQFMMMFDTGASTDTQDEDTCVAFHEATHQLVHYYRRYYLTLEDRKKNPDAPEVSLFDPRLHGETHWFQEGFAEFFGAADRISSQTGEWKLFRVYKKRLVEWGDPLQDRPQWTLEEVLRMKGKMDMAVLGEKKSPGNKETMNSLFYAQAWTLNHLLWFGKGGKYHDRFLKYINYEMRCQGGFDRFMECMGVASDEPSRAAFLEELGEDWISYQKYLLRKLRESRGGR